MMSIMDTISKYLSGFSSIQEIKDLTSEIPYWTKAEFCSINDQKCVWSDFVKALIIFADIAEFKEYKQYKRCDFSTVAENFISIIDCLSTLFDHTKCILDAKNYVYFIQNVCNSCSGHLLYLLLSHSCSNMWTTDLSIEKSKYLQCYIFSAYEVSSLENFLLVENRNGKFFFDDLLILIQKRFTKEGWKKNPVVVSVYTYSVKVISFPYLSSYLICILPPCLMLVDDYETDSKVRGIKCLNHIISNVSKTELHWQSRIDVICDALIHSLYIKKLSVLEVSLPCILLALSIAEKHMRNYRNVTDCKKHSKVFEIVLRDAEFESKWKLRRVYAQHLPAFISQLGLHSLRHLAAILNVIKNYLEISDLDGEKTRLFTIDAVFSLLRECWPRMHHHVTALGKILLKLIHELSCGTESTDDKTELLKKAQACLVKLCGISWQLRRDLKLIINLGLHESFTNNLSVIFRHVSESNR